MERPDPITAHAHERAAERHRQAASRLRDLGLAKSEAAAKAVAREEDGLAAHADSGDMEDDGHE